MLDGSIEWQKYAQAVDLKMILRRELRISLLAKRAVLAVQIEGAKHFCRQPLKLKWFPIHYGYSQESNVKKISNF